MGNLTKTEIDKLVDKSRSKQLEQTDGNNLYLFVTKKGKCRFKYRVRKDGKATWVVIGEYPIITLDEARAKALEYRKLLTNGIDINLAKKKQLSSQMTISQLIDRYNKEVLPMVRTKEKSRADFVRAVTIDIQNIIGDMYVNEVTKDIILNKLVQPKIDNGTRAAAKLTFINIKLLLGYAVELEAIESNPALKIKGRSIYIAKPRERFLSISELKQFLNLLYESQIKTQHKFAFHLSLLIITRKTELTHATWDNVDFEQKTFAINESKMGGKLLIPLPKQALILLEKLKYLSQGCNYIFKGRDGLNSISDSTLNFMLIRFNSSMFGDDKEKHFTVHDLRRTGATHLSEMGFSPDYIEVALNHKKSGIKQVYQRSVYIDQRKEMVQEWADKIDELIDIKLLPYDKEFYI